MKDAMTHDAWLKEQLKDAVFAAAYLKAASEDADPKTYLTAVLRATGLKISVVPS